VTALRRPDSAARPGKSDAGPATSSSRQWAGGPSAREYGRSRSQQGGSSPQGRGDENQGWAVLSYLFAGMIFYGGVGWLIGRWTHLSFLFPVGMLTGLVLGIVLILYRYGKA
jgi:ATP synthase protein I